MVKTVETFQDFSFKKFTEPVVIVGGCKDMAAMQKWKDVRYMESFITKKVPVEVRMDKQDARPKKRRVYMTVADMLDHMRKDTPPYYYLAEYSLSGRQKDDIRFSFDALRSDYLDNKLFLGYDSYTNAHFHGDADFLVNQVVGKKTFYLWDYHDNPQLWRSNFVWPLTKYNHIKGNFFKMDRSKLKVYKVVLHPGDSLAIPPWWFHAVHGHDWSITITTVYTHRPFTHPMLMVRHTVASIPTYKTQLSIILLVVCFVSNNIYVKVTSLLLLVALLGLAIPHPDDTLA